MLAAATTTAVPVWTLFTFVMASILGLYGITIKRLLAEKKEKKNGNCTTIAVPENTPQHEHEYVTTQMCDQGKQTIRAEMKVVGMEVTHVKEIVTRFEQSHKNEHEIMVNHFDQSLEQVKELIEKNNS